uniref:Atg6 n=1 Tax=Arundo donax TaxID=35708 RepID=A0A0A9FXE7_ARUDO
MSSMMPSIFHILEQLEQ